MNASELLAVMKKTKGSTIASIETDTVVGGIAAQYKSMSIRKVTKASVMLFNGLVDANPYLNKVNRTSDSDKPFESSEKNRQIIFIRYV